MASRRLAALFGLGLLVCVAAGGCEEPQGFVEPTSHSVPIARFRALVLPGQAKLVYRVAVQGEPAMVHPHFDGRWTLRDPERPIDVYVIPDGWRDSQGQVHHYDDTRLPAAQDSVFWSSIQDAIGGLGQLRAPSMRLHPTPGDWVIVLYNSLPPNVSTSRSEFAADVELTYFK